ncbi:DEAD/DEAH box helicase [Arenibacter aquaticus]|uniref:DEAD/DEAH box helicase n=1 Tax=Arenibacter aquaticus TaxID=2489054 RepID=A0A430JYS6_9FLAO|nr:DEAD/DEAH box helicase [Arenibacter aquaticus]RTE51972.1 DEAD/DEAH box helicase [Arenibacter aquaticus]
MGFKKIQEELIEALDVAGFKEPLPFQKRVLSQIKGGASIFGIAPKGAGKTTAIVISTLQKLNCAAFEEAPRALIYVKDKEAALSLEATFKRFTKRMDLRIYPVYEEHNIEAQRNDIFEGVDVVIATPKRLSKLFYLNGINLGKLKLFVVDDAEFLSKPSPFSDVIRIPESLDRCQYLIFSSKFDARMERMQELFMANALIVKAGK